MNISLIPQDHQDPGSRRSVAGGVLPAAYRARWALVSTWTSVPWPRRVRCAVQRPSRSRHSRGDVRPRHHCPSWFPTNSSCLVLRLPAAVVVLLYGGCLDELLLVDGRWGDLDGMGWYVKEEVQMPATGRLEGEQQCTAHADVPGKSKRVKLAALSSCDRRAGRSMQASPCRHSASHLGSASPLATAQRGKARTLWRYGLVH